MKLKRRNFLLEVIIGVILIYLSILVLLFIFQRNLMYLPEENNYSGDKIKVDIEKVKMRVRSQSEYSRGVSTIVLVKNKSRQTLPNLNKRDLYVTYTPKQ